MIHILQICDRMLANPGPDECVGMIGQLQIEADDMALNLIRGCADGASPGELIRRMVEGKGNSLAVLHGRELESGCPAPEGTGMVEHEIQRRMRAADQMIARAQELVTEAATKLPPVAGMGSPDRNRTLETALAEFTLRAAALTQDLEATRRERDWLKTKIKE